MFFKKKEYIVIEYIVRKYTIRYIKNNRSTLLEFQNNKISDNERNFHLYRSIDIANDENQIDLYI